MQLSDKTLIPYYQLLILILSLLTSHSVAAQTIVLQHANVIDVSALKTLKNQTLVIKDNKIQSIVNSNNFRQIESAQTFDMTGKYIIPGLIDSHVHHATEPDDWNNDQITRQRLRHLLRGGVTSVRDMAGDTRALSSLKRRAEIDVIQSPDIYYSVIIGGREFFSDPRTIASAKGRKPGDVDWMKAIDDDTNLDEVMLSAKGTGATAIKIYAKVPKHLVIQLTKAAKKHGLGVWSHVFIGPATPQDAIDAGIEVISHAPDFAAQQVDNFYALRREGKIISVSQQKKSFELKRYQPLIQSMKNNDTILDSTLTVFEGMANNNEIGQLLFKWGKFFTRLAHENGVKISVGSDEYSDSFGKNYPLVHHEMQLFVNEIGFTPLEAIRAATLYGAEAIGIEQNYGEVKAGKIANLVILNQDPSINIEHTLDIAHVIKNGQFVYLGDNHALPFSNARKAGGMLWLSGQIGNHPSTMTLAGQTMEAQMQQAMQNIGAILQEHDLTFNDLVKCTLMLDDIKNWKKASDIYTTFFNQLPARSAFAATGLALNAKVEIDCIAEL